MRSARSMTLVADEEATRTSLPDSGDLPSSPAGLWVPRGPGAPGRERERQDRARRRARPARQGRLEDVQKMLPKPIPPDSLQNEVPV